MDSRSTTGSDLVFPYIEESSPKWMTSQTIKLKHISYQNQLASLIIQKLYRGHRVRLRLWEFNGVLTISRAIKIQRVWRGFQGRKKAALVYSIKVLRAAHILHGLYYTWRHKRKRLVAHLKFMNNTMIKFQSQFRRRKATELVRVVRFIKHTKCAIKMQSVIRMFLGKCLVRRRRLRLKKICQHLLKYCRGQITDHSSESYTGGDLQIDSPFHAISSLDMFLCHLVAAGEYEAALDLAGKMGHCNSSSSGKGGYRGNSGFDDHIFHSDITTYVVYTSLMALWTRKGKIRAVREDYLEEALSLLQQHHMMRTLAEQTTHTASRAMRRFSSSSNDNNREVCEVPEWFTDSETYLVRDKTLNIPPEGAKVTRLGSTYDDVIVLIRQAYFDRRTKLSKQQLLAHGRVTPNLRNEYSDEWDALIESYFQTAMPHYHSTSISSYDAMILFSDCIGYHANYKQLLFGSVPLELVDPYAAAAGPHKRKHKTHKLHAMVNRKAEQLRLSQKTDHILNGQRDLTKFTTIQRTALLCEDVAYQINEKLTPIVPLEEIRRRFLMLSKRRSKQRMVFLLRRAQDLLSAGSPALEEVALRLDVFSNLYKDEDECDVLCSLEERVFFFSNQSDEAQAHPELVFDGHTSSANALDHTTNSVTFAVPPSTPAAATVVAAAPPVGEPLQQQSVKMTWQMKQKMAKDLHLKQQREVTLDSIQIIHTGNMILIQGHMTLDKLIDKFLPPPRFVEVLPQMPKRRSAAAAEKEQQQMEGKPSEDLAWKALMARAAEIPVCVRPLLLFHNEIDQLARDHELYEDQISAVDMEVSNVAAADAVYVHVKVIDYNKVTRYLLETIQIESAAVHLIPQEIRSLIVEMVRHREESGLYLRDAALARLVYTSVKFKLTELENRRTLRNDSRLAEYVTRILQKLYRGFAGRVRFRKLKKRKQERDARLRAAAEEAERVRKIENHKFNMAKEIQRIMRGRVWRAKLRVMRRAALRIQCVFRIFRAKNIVNQERLRKTAGPQVVEMFHNGRGVVVDKRKFVLQVYRCGNNYKFEGVDLLEGCTYQGHCHQPEVKEVLREHNRHITGTTVADDMARVNLWQHQRVCDLLVENLGFVARITPGTNEMGVGKVDTNLVLVINKQARAAIPSIQRTKEKPVGHFYRDYNKLLVKHPQVLLNSKSVKQIKKIKN